MDDLYAEPEPDDFRQGDIFSESLSIWTEDPRPPALRQADTKSRRLFSVHGHDDPPNGGFRWDAEVVPVKAKLGLVIVLTHDCEIENGGNYRYRQVAVIRPFEALIDAGDRLAVIEGRHNGKLYLPECLEVGLPESYVDLRTITTSRRDGLDPGRRILSLSDYGRDALQTAILRYFTEQSEEQDRSDPAG